MNAMDYEKKYNDALNLAKSYYGKGSNEFLDTIFPELAESEDERIRRALIEFCKAHDGIFPWAQEFTFSDILAWLEKQKDSSEAIEAVERIDSYITEHTANSWEMDDSNPDKKYYCGVDDTLSDIAGILQKESLHIQKTCKENADSFTGEQKEQKPLITGNDFGWIDELKHDLKHPEELDEKVQEVLKKRQKPAEWSEEDKDKLYRIIETLLADKAAARQETPKHYDVLCEAYDELISWLKSLRPSWKPSEEQIGALKEALETYKGFEEYDAMKSLYNELKKLM